MDFTRKDVLGATLAALALLVPSPASAARPQLKYVVIISRHGVRSPTWDVHRLNQYSTARWPAWRVPPGDLTPHGYTLIEVMGAYYRDWFIRQHLLRPHGCQSAAGIYIWADTDERTLETGRAFSQSLLKGCGVAVHSRPPGQKDPLFSGVGTLDPGLVLQAVRRHLPDFEKRRADLQSALDTLRFILTGGQKATIDLPPFPPKLAVSAHGNSVKLNGPLDLAASLSEDFQLEYTDGMRGTDLGWGRLTRENLLQILALHTFYADLTRRNPYLARRRGSNLMAHVLLSIQQAATGKTVAGALGRPGDSLLVLCGHDTNLSSISGMLGLSWHLKSYPPDDTPPGAALVFSLWSEPVTGHYVAKTQFIAQTLQQMHDSVLLSLASPPAIQNLSVPGCASSSQATGCPWPLFKAAVHRALDPAFVSFGTNWSVTPSPTKQQPPVILLAAGDIANCKALSGAEATAKIVESIPDATVAALGDLALKNGTAAEFANCYDKTWGAFKSRTRPAPGNHEFHSSGATPYFNYFGAAAGDSRKGYYSYQLGSWHIISMNGQCNDIGGCQTGSPEEKWLRADLRAHPAACTLAYWHEPLFSSGAEHDNNYHYRGFWRDLYAAHATIVLNGHDHDYERFAPQTPDGKADPAHGIREFVVGTGGNHPRGFGPPKPNSQVRKAFTFGVLKLTLRAHSYDWQFIPVAGKTFTDSGSGSCH